MTHKEKYAKIMLRLWKKLRRFLTPINVSIIKLSTLCTSLSKPLQFANK
jgi:hypothetical protein